MTNFTCIECGKIKDLHELSTVRHMCKDCHAVKFSNCQHDWKYYQGLLGYESEQCTICGADIADNNESEEI